MNNEKEVKLFLKTMLNIKKPMIGLYGPEGLEICVDYMELDKVIETKYKELENILDNKPKV